MLAGCRATSELLLNSALTFNDALLFRNTSLAGRLKLTNRPRSDPFLNFRNSITKGQETYINFSPCLFDACDRLVFGHIHAFIFQYKGLALYSSPWGVWAARSRCTNFEHLWITGKGYGYPNAEASDEVRATSIRYVERSILADVNFWSVNSHALLALKLRHIKWVSLYEVVGKTFGRFLTQRRF